MDRPRYHNDESYRKGYDDGVREGKRQQRALFMPHIVAAINEFENLLKEKDDGQEAERS